MNSLKQKEQNTKKGISLIVLVVTIVVIIILVATVLYNTTDGKLFGVANESVFKNDLRVIEEEFEMFVQTKATQSVGKFEIESLNAADNGLTYNTKTNEKEKDIYDVIPTAKKGYYSEFEIIKGELYYKGDVEQKLIWAKELGIGIIPYEIVDGVLISSNSNLLLLDSTGTVRIPYNVTKIDTGVFNNLEGLRKVIIPGSVKEIGRNAFSNNTSLQEVIMEEGVEIIGDHAFNGCSNLQTVKMGDSVTEIGVQAFCNCFKLKNINLSKSITKIGDFAFVSCRELNNLVLPDSVLELAGYCFSGCKALEKINIPANLKTINDGVFQNCNSLTDIQIDSNNNNFVFENEKLYNKAKDYLLFVTKEVSDVTTTEITIEEGIKNISTGALNVYTNAKVLNLPSTIQSINADVGFIIDNIERVNISENNPTYSSDGVNIYVDVTQTLALSISKEKNVTVRSGTKAIGYSAFQRCLNLESITLNNELVSIGDQAFWHTNLKSVYIPASVTFIGPRAFYDLNMESFVIDPANQNYTSDDRFVYNKNKTEIITYYKAESSVEIPEGIEKIGSMAFHNKNMIKNITIPNTVKEIGQSFGYCSGLTSITIPNSVESIDTSCFAFCNNLTQINIDNTENSISGAPWKSPYGMRVVNWLR